MDKYPIDCTGDAVKGDRIVFERSLFTGSWRNPKFAGKELIEGEIIKESYGELKGQHTFTIQQKDGSKLLIKGRNLYRHFTFRKKWGDESERNKALDEKHQRGDVARSMKNERWY